MTARLMLATVGLAAATMGCAETSSEQIWAFYLGALITDTDSQSVEHNFSDAYEPDSTSDWTTEGEQTESPAITFGEIVGLGNGQTMLVIQNRTFLGAIGEGSTAYSWDRYSEGNSYESHEQGYVYTQDWDDHVTNVITLAETDSAAVLTGAWVITTTTDDEFNEDDTWDIGLTGQSASQIPASAYLVKDGVTGGTMAASNSATASDCDSDPCRLAVTTKLVQSRTVEAVLTNYTADELDRTLETSGQAAGQ